MILSIYNFNQHWYLCLESLLFQSKDYNQVTPAPDVDVSSNSNGNNRRKQAEIANIRKNHKGSSDKQNDDEDEKDDDYCAAAKMLPATNFFFILNLTLIIFKKYSGTATSTLSEGEADDNEEIVALTTPSQKNGV
jgi:hypothetical protein